MSSLSRLSVRSLNIATTAHAGKILFYSLFAQRFWIEFEILELVWRHFWNLLHLIEVKLGLRNLRQQLFGPRVNHRFRRRRVLHARLDKHSFSVSNSGN